jgi:RHS repeat-associated protein
MINANGNRTTQVYNAVGWNTAVVDTNGRRTTYGYDNDGRQTQMIDALGRLTSYAFDAASRQTLRIDARGNRTSHVYDNANRLTGRRYPDGSRVTFSYDNAGQRTLLYDPTGRTTTVYDQEGRVGIVIGPATLRLTYAYDAVGQRKYLIEPEGLRFTYVFDRAGRISYLSNPQGQRTSYTYDAASRTTGIKLANATRSSYAYDNSDRLLRVANLGTVGSTLSSFAYAYDGVGNKRRVVEASGARVTWAYDKTYQLMNEQRSGSNSYNITYTYDKVGNRLVMINGGVRTTSVYDAANELTKSLATGGTTTYTYDLNGNQLSILTPASQRTTNIWDYENRLIQASLPSGVIDRFAYNADGQRVQKIDSSGTTNFLWDAENIILETNASNVVQGVYTIEPIYYGNILSQYRNITSAYYLYDGLGSATQLADGAGTVIDNYVYDSWGNILDATGTTPNWFRYIGKLGYYWDQDTSNYYVRSRYYSSGIGRFLSQDPLGISDTTNLYLYASNNPLSMVDPSGLSPAAVACIVATGGCAACLGPGVVACATTAQNLNDFLDCYEYYLSILPTWHKWLCGGACVGMMACVTRIVWPSPKPVPVPRPVPRPNPIDPKRIAECAAINGSYKRYCNVSCKGVTNCEALIAIVSSLTTCVTLRGLYLKKKCDYLLPGSIAKESARAENGHRIALAGASAQLGKCSLAMKAACC